MKSSSINHNRIVQGLLTYRLNHNETVAATNLLREQTDGNEAAGKQLSDILDIYLAEDRRPEVAEDKPITTIRQATHELGLDDRIEKLSDDEVWSLEERALYRRLRDLDNDPNFNKTPEHIESTFEAEVHRNFAKWDGNHDGNFSIEEVDAAMADNVNQGDSAAAIVALRLHYGKLATPHDWMDEINTGNPAAKPRLSMERLHEQMKDKESSNPVHREFRSLQKRASEMGRAPDFEHETFDPLTLNQGRVGTCIYLSTMQTRDAESLRNLITDNGNGTYTVTFGKDSIYEVQEPSLAERLFHSTDTQGGRWPALLEIAMGEYRLERDAQRLPPHPDQLSRSRLEGVPHSQAFQALAGQKTESFDITTSTVQQLRQHLQALRSQGKAAVADVSRNNYHGIDFELDLTRNGLQTGHAYTALKHDSSTDEVAIRNPWGEGEWNGAGDGDDDGLFNMPLRDFYASFHEIVSAQDCKCPNGFEEGKVPATKPKAFPVKITQLA